MTARSRSFVLLVNPRAGAGRATERLPAVQAALHEAGAAFEVVRTRGPGDATRLTRDALLAGAGGIAVLGGDGTMSEVANGFFDRRGEPVAPDAWVGVLPCGTGGDFGRSLAISRDPRAMVTRMLWARPRPIDVGWARFRDPGGAQIERAFVSVASFGIAGLLDGLLATKPRWANSGATYMLGVLRARVLYRPRRVRLTAEDGESQELDVLNVAVANGSYFGGGMKIAPHATVDDGLFDIVTIESRGLVQEALMTPSLFRGTLLEHDGVRHQRASRLRAEPADWAGRVLIDLDGESAGALPATFEIRRSALLLRA